jgi:hypothetical protein
LFDLSRSDAASPSSLNRTGAPRRQYDPLSPGERHHIKRTARSEGARLRDLGGGRGWVGCARVPNVRGGGSGIRRARIANVRGCRARVYGERLGSRVVAQGKQSREGQPRPSEPIHAVPFASRGASFDHLVGAGEERRKGCRRMSEIEMRAPAVGLRCFAHFALGGMTMATRGGMAPVAG